MQIKTETTVGIFILAALGAFGYMSFQIGVFRFDKARYVPYIAYFQDISGLTKKADVKIAGVKVGWLDSIELGGDGKLVKTKLMVLKDYILPIDTHAIVRQEGILGNKYLEVIPGDPILPKLKAGGSFARPSRESLSVDDLLFSFKKIAGNIEEVSVMLKDSLSSKGGTSGLKDTLNYFGQAAQKIASTSETLERMVVQNESNMNVIMSDVRSMIHELKDRLPETAHNLSDLAQRLNNDYMPRVANGVDSFKAASDEARDVLNSLKDRLPELATTLNKVGTTLNNDVLPQVSDSLSKVGSSFDDAKDGLRNVRQVAEKINSGQGLLGKIINEDETYYDIKEAAKSLRNSLDKVERLAIVVDGHVESLYAQQQKMDFRDAKGYVDFIISPCEDYFYLAGFAFSQRGFIKRDVFHYKYFDENGTEILPSQLVANHDMCNLVSRAYVTKEERDSFRLDLQFGKSFKDVSFRVGLFEGSLGVGVDYLLPTERLSWITSLEAFDFNGRNRLCEDKRPHLKWLNKMFVTPNIYLAFGADDFISRDSKNAFAGAGMRFCDDDLKYILSKAF